MRDQTGRRIRYLRLSVTDACNLRCRYCAPADISSVARDDLLTREELTQIAEAGIKVGLDKIRLTGGEPLMRPDIAAVTAQIAALPGLRELAMTTNGMLLGTYAQTLQRQGLNRVNISLDTLNAKKFKAFTRGGRLDHVLGGLSVAEAVGLTPIKLNVVLIGGENDDEIADFVALTEHRPINVRFIELMPLGESAHWPESRFIPVDRVLEACPTLEPATGEGAGVARIYQLPGAVGKVGLISPMSRGFCNSCDRVRITADGKLKPCLHSDEEIPLRGLRGPALEEALRAGIAAKPREHSLEPGRPSESGRNMNQIGG